MYKKQNKQLLVYGYLHQFSLHDDNHNYVPLDIIKYILKCYDNSFIWKIKKDDIINSDIFYLDSPHFEIFSGFMVQISIILGQISLQS